MKSVFRGWVVAAFAMAFMFAAPKHAFAQG